MNFTSCGDIVTMFPLEIGGSANQIATFNILKVVTI